ncbi:DUF4232 domain-containing protein [Streptomyces paromomycinus]|uniref:DUF4232 domain-containing protein n=1 Tax=Streptomyces paromomycinus TaxID=92743 RepID=A0A401W4C3_STREY|nr:DUF4232 domain-containing protein [Streptomyces paromomycinus]GCD44156.1 hypothetical protein GKJPGBOP_03847 [Streptomyces paromomycinus]
MSASIFDRTTRRRTLRVAAAALTAAAALSLTACSGSDAAASKAGGQSGSGAAAEAGGAGSAGSGGAGSDGGAAQGSDAQPDSAKPGSGEGTAPRAGSGGGAPSRAGSGGGAAKGGGKGKFCRTSELMMGATDSSPDQETGDVTVQMTNKGGRSCSVTGFAGVDLKDADGTSAPVHRGGEQPRITDLRPGDTATFSISYSVDSSGGNLATPTHLIVTPPNETHSVSLKWPAGAPKLAGPYDEKIKVHPVGIAN